MASDCKVSTTALNAACSAIVSLVDAAAGPGHLIIFDDALAIPADCASTLTSNPLADLPFQKPAWNSPEQGIVYGLFEPGPHAAVDSGTASYFRIYDDDTNCVMQGTVGDGDDFPVDLRVESKSFQLSGAVSAYLFQFSCVQLPVGTYVPDETPNAFSFTPITNADLSTAYVFGPIIVDGISSSETFEGDIPLEVPMTITNARYRINKGPWQTVDTNVRLFDSIEVEVTSSGSNGTLVTGTLNINGVSADANVTTTGPAPDSDPDPFSFTDVTNATLSTEYTSNSITITGINVTVPFTVVGGSWSKNGGAFVAGVPDLASGPSGTVVNNDQIRLRVTSSGSYSAPVSSSLNFATRFDEYLVTTQAAPAPDATPDPWTYSPATNVPVNTVVESEGHTPTGINTNMPVSVNFGEFKINDFAWRSTPVNMIPGSVIRVRHTSSGSNSTTTTQQLSCNNGAVVVPFAVTTEASTGAGLTSLASPSWLLDAEDFAGAKMGLAYYETDYRTQFLADTGGGTTVTVSTQSELLTQVAAAKSNSAISAINCNPGVTYTLTGGGTSNPLNGLNRPTNNPLVIRTTPGSPSQAKMVVSYSGTSLTGLALVDLWFAQGLTLQGVNNGSLSAPKDILIERNVFSWDPPGPITTGGACQITCQGSWLNPPGVEGNGHEITAYASNINIRLNVFYGSSGVIESDKVMNTYTFATQNALFEGNVYDHGGWLPQYNGYEKSLRRNTPAGTGMPTDRKHNCYLNAPSPGMVVRYNIVARSSSHGLHCKGGNGVKVYRNLLSMNPIAIQMGYGSDAINYNYGIFPNMICRDNVIIGGEDIRPGQTRGIGIWFTNVNLLDIHHNYCLYGIAAAATNSGMFVPESDWPITNTTIHDNKSFSWQGLQFQPRGNGSYIPQYTNANNLWNVPSISSAASTRALQIGGHPTRSIANTYWDNYGISRRRLGVDIRELQNELAVFYNGFN